MKQKIFYPNSAAIVGASQKPEKAGHQLMKALIDEGYTGKIYPVHPREKEIMGLECYRSIKEIKAKVDAVVFCIPAFAVLEVMKEAAERGDVKTAIIVSAGFSETRIEERVELEKEVVKIARENGIRIFGPNCNGFINTEIKFTTSFAPGQDLSPGDIGFITQSGAFGGSVMMRAAEEPKPLGFNKWAHVGNMSDISNLEILDFYRTDPGVKVIGMYMEGVEDGREFMRIGSKVAGEKPLFTLKVGRTELGSKAALSHTGTLAGSDKIYDTAFKQSGMLRVDTMEELVDGLKAGSMLPRAKGNKIAILTEAGGPGIISMDVVGKEKEVQLANVSAETAAELEKCLPPMAMICKPDGYIDMTAAAMEEAHAEAMRLLLADPGVESLLMICLPPIYLSPENIAEVIVEVAGEFDKPVAACFMKGESMKASREYLEKNGIPTFDTPERTAQALINNIKISQEINSERKKGLKDEAELIYDKDKYENILVNNLDGDADPLEPDVYNFLREYDLDLLPYYFVNTKEDVLAKAEKLGYPLVMKVVSPQIIHKSDVGGVKLNLKNSSEVEKAYEQLTIGLKDKINNADIKGVLIRPFVTEKGGQEVIIGVTSDPQFGPTVMFGLGGIFVEIFKDVSFRVAPFTKEEALAMIKETKAYEILKGARGGKTYDIDALTDLLVRIGDIVTINPAIKELDLNPVLVKEDGYSILDARLIVK